MVGFNTPHCTVKADSVSVKKYHFYFLNIFVKH